MIGDTLTLENLREIYEAMSKIKPIDQSENYTLYFKEIEERLHQKETLIRLAQEAEQELKDLED